jgi:predicted XRE-type DNA-binding protein
MTQEHIFVSEGQGASFEESSGNVFADLGLEDADELFIRGKIGIQVLRILKQRNLKQREISQLLGIPQPEVSHLMKGEFQRFSEGKLLTFLKKLDTEIILHLRHSRDRFPNTSDDRANETIISL